jgi:hypothetical protein
MKKILVTITLAGLTASCSGSEMSNDQSPKYKIQVTFLESGVTLEQCNGIREKLDLEPSACDLISSQYSKYEMRAKRIIANLPKDFREKNTKIDLKKMTNLFMDFPDTSDKEVVDALMNKDECKKK